MHILTGTGGLGHKSWEFVYDNGPAAALERQGVLIRQQLEALKAECGHPEHMQRIEDHQFKYAWDAVSTWTSTHCARCNSVVRSDTKYIKEGV